MASVVETIKKKNSDNLPDVRSRLEQELKEVIKQLEKSGLKRTSSQAEDEGKIDEGLEDKAYIALKKSLPQKVQVEEAITVAIPPALIKKQLAVQTKLTLVLGFSGRVPNRYELIQWIQGPQVLGHGGAIENTNYLTKGFCSVRFKEDSQNIG